MLSQTRNLFLVVSLSTFLILGSEWVPHALPTFDATTLLLSGEAHDDDRIWRWDEVDEQPQPLNYQQVKGWIGYPETAYQAGIQGDVTLRVLVNEAGEYERHEIAESFHPLLRIPCEVFTPLMVFKPASHNGKAVKCWIDIAYHFEIPDYGK